MHAIVVGHDWVAAELGVVADWVEAQGMDIHRVWREDGVRPEAADGADLVVLMGSPDSLAGTTPDAAIPGEAALTRRALAAGTPVFGICYGSQELAGIAGGTVETLPARSAGWFPLTPGDGGAPALDAGPWLRWHGDGYQAVPGAEVLARGAGPDCVQAFRYGSAWGVQFHPEVDAGIIERLGRATDDPEDEWRPLAEYAEAHADELRRRSWALLDAFWADVTGAPQPATASSTLGD